MKTLNEITTDLMQKGYQVTITEMDDSTKQVAMIVAKKKDRIKYLMITKS